MGPESSTRAELVIERYRFIVGQIAFLNTSISTLLNFYYGAIAAVIGGVALALGEAVQTPSLRSIINVIMNAATLVIVMLSAFVALQILAHIFSWVDLRKEEVVLLCAEGVARAGPRWRNAWRWSEIYFLVFVVATCFFAIRFVNVSVATLRTLR